MLKGGGSNQDKIYQKSKHLQVLTLCLSYNYDKVASN
jgi:hypothetical protein